MTLQDTITAPPIRSIGEYSFPSKSAAELYGDDQLIHVWWKGNQWFAAAACFRAPKAMPFGAFWEALFVPFFSEDPDFDASMGAQQFAWFIDDKPVTPVEGTSLADLGATHKCVIRFETA